MDILKEIKSLSKVIGEEKTTEIYEQIEALISNSETFVSRVNDLAEENDELNNELETLQYTISDLEYKVSDLEYEVADRFHSLSDFDIEDMIDHLECEGYTMVKENNNVTLDNVDTNLLDEIIRLFNEGNFEERQEIYNKVKNKDKYLLNYYFERSSFGV